MWGCFLVVGSLLLGAQLSPALALAQEPGGPPPPVSSAVEQGSEIDYASQTGASSLSIAPSTGEAQAIAPNEMPGPVPFNGGYVQHHIRIFVTFYGSEWNGLPGAKEAILNLYRWLGGSPYQQLLTQYFDFSGYVADDVALSASYTDPRAPSAVNDSTIKEEVEYSIAHQGWGSPNYENQYVVLFPPGTPRSQSWEAACAAHGWSGTFAWVAVPWSLKECQRGLEPSNAMQVSASHEYAETVTDPITASGYRGWENEGAGGEIGDICNTGTPAEQAQVAPGLWVAKVIDDYKWAYKFVDPTSERCEEGDSGPARFSVITTGPTITLPHTAMLQGSINPAGWDAFYSFALTGPQGTQYLPGNRIPDPSRWYGFSPVPGGFSGQSVSAEVGGLKGNTTYQLRLDGNGRLTASVSAEESGALQTIPGSTIQFTTPDWRPISTTEAPTAVKGYSATLHARINPQGEPTEYQFEYGTTTGYGSSVPVPSGSAGSGIAAVPVEYALSGLEEATVYHYRVRATNGEGTSYGSDQVFRTPGKPVLVTPPTTRYTNTFEPQLTGLIIPNGAATTYQFEYGPTTAYGTKVPANPASIGASLEQISVGQYLSGLQSGTTYHFRLVAENEVGTTTSADQTFTTLPPCKGAEGKCAWSAQATIDPPPFTEDELKGVSCASATLCMAIGLNHYQAKSLIERWNGSSWSLVQSIGGELKGISCPATTTCVAVGVGSGGGAKSWMLSELNGSWGVTAEPVTPLPVGATESTLNAVSCVTTVCTAVGSYRNFEGTYRPLVERWNGSAWGVQLAPNPSEGSAQKAMLGISCPATSFCLTVGEAANKPFAERYSSTEGWKVITAPKPSGAAGAKLASVSCATATFCMAAGDSYEGMGTEKTLAERWDGTSLTITSSPNPAGAQGWVNFTGVSCASTTACTAVGYYASKVEGVPSELKTLAESWNGSAWSLQSPTNPAASTHSVLESVSCYSTTGCTAVGLAEPGPAGETEVTLAEGWNGTTWSTQATVNPAPLTEDELKDVACLQAGGACFAVGRNVYRQDSFIELWNGTGWQFLQNTPGEIKRINCEPLSTFCTAVGKSASGAPQSWMISEYKGSWLVLENTAPVPAGGTATTLNGVSCTSTACTAVGNYLNSEGTYRPLVERWNGSTWLLQEAPNPPGGGVQNAMLAVSCSTSTSCMAVGEVAGKPVAETWNGSSWSVVSVPLPAGATAGKLTSVACPALGACFAAGYSYEKVGAEKALVESWNGTTWSVTAVPNPADAQGYVNLASISCLSPRACVAAGAYAPSVSGGAPASLKPMVESLTGTQWSLQTPAAVAGFGFAGFSGISCATVIACNAVGSKSTAQQGQPVLTMAERYG
jgi:hypothetical protein